MNRTVQLEFELGSNLSRRRGKRRMDPDRVRWWFAQIRKAIDEGKTASRSGRSSG